MPHRVLRGLVPAAVLGVVALTTGRDALSEPAGRTGGTATSATGQRTESPAPLRVACWIADGAGMQPTGELEGFLADRLGASGEQVVVDPSEMRVLLRMLGLDQRHVFDPEAARRMATAANADRVIWVKLVSRDVQPKKVFTIPYLLNRRRLDAHVFFDVRVYDPRRDAILGSKRLQLTERGEGTWQVTDDEPLDPAYNNDATEIHERMRRLDWRAAAAISGYCADLLRQTRPPLRVSVAEPSVPRKGTAQRPVAPAKAQPSPK